MTGTSQGTALQCKTLQATFTCLLYTLKVYLTYCIVSTRVTMQGLDSQWLHSPNPNSIAFLGEATSCSWLGAAVMSVFRLVEMALTASWPESNILLV